MRRDEPSMTARAAHGLMLAVKLKRGLGSDGGGGWRCRKTYDQHSTRRCVCRPQQPVLNEKHKLVCLKTQ